MGKFVVEYEYEEEITETQWIADEITVEADSEDEAIEEAERQLRYLDGLDIIDVYEED